MGFVNELDAQLGAAEKIGAGFYFEAEYRARQQLTPFVEIALLDPYMIALKAVSRGIDRSLTPMSLGHQMAVEVCLETAFGINKWNHSSSHEGRYREEPDSLGRLDGLLALAGSYLVGFGAWPVVGEAVRDFNRTHNLPPVPRGADDELNWGVK
jgi:hypothetical protein